MPMIATLMNSSLRVLMPGLLSNGRDSVDKVSRFKFCIAQLAIA